MCLNKKSRWDFFGLIWKLGKIICNYKPTTVISSLHYTNIVAVLASLCLKRKFKLIICEHCYHRKYLPDVRLRFLKRRLMEFTYRKADMVVAVSKGIKEIA